MSFWPPLHVFRSEPDPQLFATHLLVQPPSELIVLAAIADEARLVLIRLHRPDERRQVSDETLRHATAAQEYPTPNGITWCQLVSAEC